jgi:hypothetical protein
MPRRYLGTAFVVVLLLGLGAFASLQYTSQLSGATACVREALGLQSKPAAQHASTPKFHPCPCPDDDPRDVCFCPDN